MVDHRTGAAARAAGTETEEPSSGDERHFLGAADGCSLAGLARALRSLHDGVQSLTTAYNRFNRWRKDGIWDRLMDAVTKAHDGQVQMIDSSIVRVHQHASGVKKRVEIVAWAA